MSSPISDNLTTYTSRIHYFIFDLLVCNDRDLTGLALSERRDLIKSTLSLWSPRIRIAEQFEVTASDTLSAVRQHQLEGVIAKRKASLYEAGKRSGAWVKCRANRGQELVIGGYIPSVHGFDSLVVGYYKGKDLMYLARVRNGFVQASRRLPVVKHKNKSCQLQDGGQKCPHTIAANRLMASQ